MKTNTINADLLNRIRILMSHFGLNQSQFAKRAKIQPSNLSAILNGKRPCEDAVINKLVLSYDINKDWLLTGNGNMLLNGQDKNSSAQVVGPYISENLIKIRSAVISPTASFNEFAQTPPEDYDFTSITPEPGETIGADDMVFTINGDSMYPEIKNRTKVLGVFIRPQHWHWARDVVIIAYDDYFVIKRVKENNLDTGNHIVLSSDNPDYPQTVTVPLSSIRVMYQASRIVSAPIR